MRSLDRRVAMKHPMLAAIAMAACLGAATPAAAQSTARDMYTRALEQERIVRDDASKPTLAQMRRVVAAYEALVRRHPASGYADNALWQAANLASLPFDRFGDATDRNTAARLFAQLASGYPSSKLAAQAQGWLAPKVPATSTMPPDDSTSQKRTTTTNPGAAGAAPATGWLAPKVPATSTPTTLREITRTVLPDGVRLTIDLDSEVTYYQ